MASISSASHVARAFAARRYRTSIIFQSTHHLRVPPSTTHFFGANRAHHSRVRAPRHEVFRPAPSARAAIDSCSASTIATPVTGHDDAALVYAVNRNRHFAPEKRERVRPRGSPPRAAERAISDTHQVSPRAEPPPGHPLRPADPPPTQPRRQRILSGAGRD